MFPHKRVCLIPLDRRPVCYTMPRQLAQSAGLELFMPSLKLLGHLKAPGDLNALFRWVKNHLFEKDPLIVALDTLAYGGLISSRVNTEPYPVLEKRISSFFEHLHVSTCYAFSSILRIPDYNNHEEEPDYWKTFGTQLYQYSCQSHQQGKPPEHAIPQDILTDFLTRRQKNFRLNEYHLGLLQKGQINYLTFGQDDTGTYGLNVQEADRLKLAIQQSQRCAVSQVKTGMDELAVCMLARWVTMQLPASYSVFPLYSHPEGSECIARFDGIPIHSVVTQAIESCGASMAASLDQADLVLMVHTPVTAQGDHCEKPSHDFPGTGSTLLQHELVIKTLQQALEKGTPFVLADVAYANGGDPVLMEKLVTAFDDLTGLYGYAGWNTPGNTIGSALAMGLVRLVAEQKKSFYSEPFCELLLTRLADDWLYQSQVRSEIRAKMRAMPFKQSSSLQSPCNQVPDEKLLNALMADGLALLKRKFGLESRQIQCRYPCQRDFEVEIMILP